jgi:hypothetical protein
MVQCNGLDDSLGVNDIPQHMFMQDSFRVKCATVVTSRWFQLLQRLDASKPLWHMKLVIFIYLRLCSGMDIQGGQQTMLRDERLAVNPQAPGEDEAKLSTKSDNNDIRAIIKQGCTNGLHFCVNVLGDLEMFHMVSGLLEIMRPLSEMHSEQSHKLRDTVGCCDWYVGQACGAGLAVTRQVASQLSRQHVLQAAGLHFDGDLPSGLLWSSMTADHPLAALEDASASN